MIRLLKIPLEILKTIGMAIGRFNNLLLMLISFYLLLLPIGFVRRTFAPKERPTGWQDREKLDRKHFEKQF